MGVVLVNNSEKAQLKRHEKLRAESS